MHTARKCLAQSSASADAAVPTWLIWKALLAPEQTLMVVLSQRGFFFFEVCITQPCLITSIRELKMNTVFL